MPKAVDNLKYSEFNIVIEDWPFEIANSDFLFNQKAYVLNKLEKGVFVKKISVRKKDWSFEILVFLSDGNCYLQYKSPLAMPIVNGQSGFEKIEICIEILMMELIKMDIKTINWIHFPDIYNEKLSPYIIQSLINLGFVIEGSSLNYHLATNTNFNQNLSNDTARRLNKIDNSGFILESKEIENSDGFYSKLLQWRENRNIEVNISKETIDKDLNALSSKYRLFTCHKDKILIAFALGVKVSENVMYMYLPAHDPDYDNFSPVIGLTREMFEYAKTNAFKILDLGIASEMKGEENYGLIRFKEKCGGIPSMKYQFIKRLK